MTCLPCYAPAVINLINFKYPLYLASLRQLISVGKRCLQLNYLGGIEMTKTTAEMYKEYFEADYESKLNKYKEWKKDRPLQHQKTKELRKAKAEATKRGTN